jgi:class 3 adenylate cyclase
MENEVVRVKYVFLDTVGYSRRTRDAQGHIIRALQKVVDESVARHTKPGDRIVYLPTGDGICIALVRVNTPPDVHMRIALSVLEGIERHNQPFDPPKPPPPDDPDALDDSRWFKVRIGLNAGEDILYEGINGRDNLAGEAINTAARVMDFADGGQILVGEAAYTDIHAADQYARAFRKYEVTFKHGRDTRVYQYVPDPHPEWLNVEPPSDIAHGIDKFDSRADERLKRQLLSAIENARGTVWLLGVALSDEINLVGDILKRLGPKVGKMDVKILLLDALRSPAVFRAFLEGRTKSDEFKEMAERERERRRAGGSDEPLNDPYYLQPIYSSFERTLTALWGEMRDNPAYKMASGITRTRPCAGWSSRTTLRTINPTPSGGKRTRKARPRSRLSSATRCRSSGFSARPTPTRSASSRPTSGSSG